jgi:manganese/iron transport system permease protein
MLDWVFWAPVMVGGLLAGASSGLLGVFIVGMRIPFLGVCVAHAALAGAVFGTLGGLTGQALLIPALGCSMVTALVLGLADPHRLGMDTNVVMGILFSASMGLALLGIGMFPMLGKSDYEVRALLWGSLNFCRWRDVGFIAAGAVMLLAFLSAFGKEMRAILFSRSEAQAVGIHATAIWSGFLVLCAVGLTVNFQVVGALMIYSLAANPAAAAFQLVRGSRRAMVVAAALGGFSGLGGFLLAAWTDLPTGPVIVLLSSALVVLAGLWRRFVA